MKTVYLGNHRRVARADCVLAKSNVLGRVHREALLNPVRALSFPGEAGVTVTFSIFRLD